MRTSTPTRILLLALASGVLVDIVLPGNAIGLNAPLLVAALLAGAAIAAGPVGLRRMDPADAWLAPAALVLAAFAVLRSDGWLVAWDLTFAAALAAGAVAALGGARITRGLVPEVVETAAGLIGAAMVGLLGIVGPARLSARDASPAPDRQPARPRVPAWLGGRARAGVRRSAPVLRGLLLAAPIVLVFAVLFALADAVFARVLGDALAWRPEVDPWDALGRALVVGTAAWLVAGMLALGAGLLPSFLPHEGAWRAARAGSAAQGGRSLGAASVADLPLPGRYRLGTAEASTVLLVVDLLFAAFVALQVAYLFGGLDTMAASGITYADYARRGFFELVLVAALAGLLVVGLDVAVRRRSWVQLGASLALFLLTALVLASAFVRIRLYQDAYGWTELRLMVVVAIGWLAVALVVVGGLLVGRKARWTLHVLGITVLVTLAGLNLVGPQAFVTDRNLERALDPSLVPAGGRTGLDAGYLEQLGDEAVPAVVTAWPALGQADRAVLAPFLQGRADILANDPDLQGWPAWNLARERARSSLAGWAADGSTLPR